MKIRSKIVTIFLVIFIVIFGVATTIELNFANNLIFTQISQHITTASIWRFNALELYIKDQKEMISLMGASTVFRDFLNTNTQDRNYISQKNIAEQRLTRSIKETPQIIQMFILNTSGKVVASSSKEHEGTDFSNDDFYTQAQNKTYFKDMYNSKDDQALVYAISTPIKDDATGKTLGVVVAEIDTTELYALLLDRSGMGDTGETYIVNGNGFFISPSRFLDNSILLAKKNTTQNVTECLNNKDNDPNIVKFYTDYRGIQTIGTHNYISETGWCLITKMDKSEYLAENTNLLEIVIFIFLCGLTLFTIFGFIFSKKITEPIVALTKGVKIIEAGDLNHKVSINTKDETGELSVAFDNMTDKFREIYDNFEDKIKQRTSQLEQSNKEMSERNHDLEETRKAIQNILDDVAADKIKQDVLLAGVGEGIIATDKSTNIIFVNKAAEDVLGFSYQELIGRKYSSVVKSVDSHGATIEDSDRIINKVLKTGLSIKTDVQADLYYVKRNGSTFPVAITVTPIIQKKELTGEICVFRDITKEKNIDRMKTEFISLASHQLRTPLSAIKWYLEMLIDGDAGELQKEQMEFINNINLSNERMIELVNSLLNVSRIESGRIIIDPQPTDIKELINNTVFELTQKFEQKEIRPLLSINQNLPEIDIDKKLIRQVFLNLLSNAIKYTPTGGEISIFISKDSKDLITQITDNGYGIPAKDAARVFTKFYRGENIIKTETDGNGLGLYLVKAIVESSGGKIWYESEEGKGTTFWFSLPLSGSTKKEGSVSIDS